MMGCFGYLSFRNRHIVSLTLGMGNVGALNFAHRNKHYLVDINLVYMSKYTDGLQNCIKRSS